VARGRKPDQNPGQNAAKPGLSAVIGRHVRAFRTEQRETLRSLADRSGLSVGFLSQLERGQTSIGLTNLRDLALCLGHDIVEFFDEQILGSPESEPTAGSTAEPTTGPGPGAAIDDPVPSGSPDAAPGDARYSSPDKYFTLTRSSGEHTSQFLSGTRTYRMLSQRAAGLLLEPMLVEIAPGGTVGEPEAHRGEEFAYVVSGELTFTVAGTTHRLGPGDSLHLKSSIPHHLHNDTDQVVVVVSVVTPRLF